MSDMMTKKKDIEYYINLPYKVVVTAILPEEGGGFMAEIPQLGRYAFLGDGETPEEAVKDLEIVKRYIFEDYLEAGIDIPEPE